MTLSIISHCMTNHNLCARIFCVPVVKGRLYDG